MLYPLWEVRCNVIRPSHFPTRHPGIDVREHCKKQQDFGCTSRGAHSTTQTLGTCCADWYREIGGVSICLIAHTQTSCQRWNLTGTHVCDDAALRIFNEGHMVTHILVQVFIFCPFHHLHSAKVCFGWRMTSKVFSLYEVAVTAAPSQLHELHLSQSGSYAKYTAGHLGA